MQHLIKKALMVAVVVIAAVIIYMGVKRYYATKKVEDVKVQFLNFGGSYTR